MKIRMGMGTQISGSLAGVTAGHNKGGQYLRNRSIPTNPNTARQQSVRSGFGAAVQSWSDSLSENDRQSWRDYAQQVDVTDAFGDPKQLSGQQWYVGLATLIAQAENSELVDVAQLPDFSSAAPGIANTGAPPGPVASAEFDNTTPPGQIDLSGPMDDPASADGTVLLFIGAPVTPGTRFYKGPYQLASASQILEDAATWSLLGDFSTTDTWVADTVVTPANVEAFFPIRIRIVYGDGRVSQELRELVQFTDVTP